MPHPLRPSRRRGAGLREWAAVFSAFHARALSEYVDIKARGPGIRPHRPSSRQYLLPVWKNICLGLRRRATIPLLRGRSFDRSPILAACRRVASRRIDTVIPTFYLAPTHEGSRPMRGTDEQPGSMCSYVSLEDRVTTRARASPAARHGTKTPSPDAPRLRGSAIGLRPGAVRRVR